MPESRSLSRKFQVWSSSILLLAILLIALRLLGGLTMPVVQDEAYYFHWARFLDLGYFDHPPMVAWWAALGNLFPGSGFWSRFGTMMFAILLIPLTISLCREAGLRDRSRLWVALLLFHVNLGGILFGFLATPDAPLIFFWTLALHESIVALHRDPRRWLTAGLATGLGLWGKYTMSLIGPVFLWGLLRDKNQGLKSPWPYLGGVVALLVLAPHLYWNSQHHWISLKFQFGHGIQGTHEVDLELGTDLPAPLPLVKNSEEFKVGDYFMTPEDRDKPPKPEKTAGQKLVQRLQDFATSQALIWGGLLIPLVAAWRQNRRSRSQNNDGLYPAARHILTAAVVVPLGVFGLIALSKPIEANWPAIYLLGAGILLAGTWTFNLRSVQIAAALNVLLIAVLILHAHVPLPTKGRDRVLFETSGYQDLATFLQSQSLPILADTYQNVAMLSFYMPNRAITQWPDITRHSEITRRPAMNPHSLKDLKASGFILVSEQEYPPRLPGFQMASVREVRDCRHGGQKVSLAFETPTFTPPCRNVLHRWFIIHYRSL